MSKSTKRYLIEQDNEEIITDKFFYNLQKYWSSYHLTQECIIDNSLTSDIADKYYMNWLCVIANYANAAHLWTTRIGFSRPHHIILRNNIETEMTKVRDTNNIIKNIIEYKIAEKRQADLHKKYKVGTLCM